MFGFGKMEFMQSYYREKAEEVYKLITDAGFECTFEEFVPKDKKKKKVPGRHIENDRIYHVVVKKKEYDKIVEALSKRNA
ncbi:MAG: hypothetical protein K6F37_03345 [Lachnospiraceae bacterium]|nr:hypothetical protein [Lachnospiraceae bacterium]